MITLLLNGSPLPSTLVAGVPVTLTITLDGEPPLQANWSVWQGLTRLAIGEAARISFVPEQPVTTSINVFAVRGDGTTEAQTFTVQAEDRQGGGTLALAIDWSKVAYAKGETLSAHIRLVDPRGLGHRMLNWDLYRNSVWQASGQSTTVIYPNAEFGVYRVVAKVSDPQGGQVVADSSVAVPGNFEIQATLAPADGRTMQFLGCVYTSQQVGDHGFSSAVGMPLTVLPEDVYLLPGTTHFQVDLDPATVEPPGQVVVRTPTGNWSVAGLPPGSIPLPYEFLDSEPYVPAPADLRLQLSTEAFATAAGAMPHFDFRVRIKCYYEGPQLYQFQACGYNSSIGGNGTRARRFTALFSQVDLLTDTDSTQHRLGIAADKLQTYVTYLPTTLPIPLSIDGKPDVSNEANRIFYTDQNWVTTYDPVDAVALEVDAHSTYAIEQARPFCMSFMMPAFPTIIQRPRRLHGQVAIYMANGYVNAGTVVTVAVLAAGGFAQKQVQVPITANAFSPDQETYVRIGIATVDISDQEFVDNGIVGMISLDETGADVGTYGTLPPTYTAPDPAPLDQVVYSTNSSPYATLDGACYYNVGPVSVMTGTTISNNGSYLADATGTVFPLVSNIAGCFDPQCGPVGLYCYGESSGTTTMHVPQQLYNPAPFIAPASQVTHCYCNPCLIETWLGTLPAYPPFVAYQDSTLCGVAWEYQVCQNSLALNQGASPLLVVPYPPATVPPDFILYGEACYGNTGNILSDTTGHAPVTRFEVTPVFDCLDVACTGSVANGAVASYTDYETGSNVSVGIDHADQGLPIFALIPQTYDDGALGLASGAATISVSKHNPEYNVLTVNGTGVLSFSVSSAGVSKQLIRYRAGLPTIYSMGSGTAQQKIPVVPGDRIALRIFAPQPLNVSVTWTPLVPVPRLYASATVPLALGTPDVLFSTAALGTFAGTLSPAPTPNNPPSFTFSGSCAVATTFTWNSIPGNVYVVKEFVFQFEVSPHITATDTTTHWTIFQDLTPGDEFGPHVRLVSGTPHTINDSYVVGPATETFATVPNPSNADQVTVSSQDTYINGTYTYSSNSYTIVVFPSVPYWALVAPPTINYFTASANPVFPTRIHAVGFTGLTDRSTYAFYGTLPGDVFVSEVNPDSILTVTSNGHEYVVLRARASSDPASVLPSSAWYQHNQELLTPLVFKLYAGRSSVGQCGEMDVWLDTPSSLPPAFSVSPYKALVLNGTAMTNFDPEVHRNSLRVIPQSLIDTSNVLNQHRWPTAYIDSNGDRVVVATATRPATLVFNGSTYTRAGVCPGLAYSVIGA